MAVRELFWEGFGGSTKPHPNKVWCTNGFSLRIDPKAVIESNGKGAMFTLSREFPHPTDLLHKATPAAQQRFFKDSKRFPPQSYEERSLAWKDTAWRQLYPEERCSIMGLPIGYLDPLTVGEGDSQDASSV